MNQTRRPVIPALLGAVAIVLSACAAEGTPTTTESAATPSPSAAETTASASASAEASASEAESSDVRVRMKNQAYDPPELTVAVGTEVTFLNADSFTHTVTEGQDGVAVADPIVNEEVERGQSAKVTFDEPGTYHITCTIHSSMNITITVEG